MGRAEVLGEIGLIRRGLCAVAPGFQKEDFVQVPLVVEPRCGVELENR